MSSKRNRPDGAPATPAKSAAPGKLRLLKVVVQPTFVLDDGTTLKEVPVQPFAVTAAEWPAVAAMEPTAWIKIGQDSQATPGGAGKD